MMEECLRGADTALDWEADLNSTEVSRPAFSETKGKPLNIESWSHHLQNASGGWGGGVEGQKTVHAT